MRYAAAASPPLMIRSLAQHNAGSGHYFRALMLAADTCQDVVYDKMAMLILPPCHAVIIFTLPAR